MSRVGRAVICPVAEFGHVFGHVFWARLSTFVWARLGTFVWARLGTFGHLVPKKKGKCPKGLGTFGHAAMFVPVFGHVWARFWARLGTFEHVWARRAQKRAQTCSNVPKIVYSVAPLEMDRVRECPITTCGTASFEGMTGTY